MQWNPFNTSIGLALGGGAAKGIAHIGVIKALEEEQIEISYIAGTSVGAIIAAYYAFGKSSDEIKKISTELTAKNVLGLTLPKKGFFSTDRIKNMIKRDLGNVQIQEAKIPLAICTTDIKTGEQVIFRKGPLAEIVCASAAVPGIFVPVQIGDRVLVDGGLTENVPVSELEVMGASYIIAVDLSGVTKYAEPKDITSIIANSMDIAIDLKTKSQLKRANLVLSLDLSGYGRLDNSDRIEQLIHDGYLPMKEQISKVFWYKNHKYFAYIKKLFYEFLPVKIPKIIKDYYRKTVSRIQVK